MGDYPGIAGGVFAFVVGACFGSFVNVLAYRLPRELSIVAPGSFCPNCERPIPWRFNIPILSFIGLRGRCIMCGAPIPFRDLLTEIALAVCALYLYLNYPLAEAAARFIFCAGLFAASLVDAEWRIIPDEISLSGVVIGIPLATFVIPAVGWKSSLIGVAFGGVFLFLIGEVYRLLRGKEGMGMGDVKLLAMVGAFMGWPGVFFTIFFGSLAGSVGGIALALSGQRTPPPVTNEQIAMERAYGGGGSLPQPLPDQADERDISLLQTTIPFGPFLSMAAAFFALFQKQLAHWYFS